MRVTRREKVFGPGHIQARVVVEQAIVTLRMPLLTLPGPPHDDRPGLRSNVPCYPCELRHGPMVARSVG
jgi:hypothetical protein